jgi:hypothetical protein
MSAIKEYYHDKIEKGMRKIGKNYNVVEVLKSFRNKKDIRIEGYYIYILSDFVYIPKINDRIINPIKSFDLGNGSWGKIDFLVKVHDFTIIYVNNFNNI